MMKKGNYGMTHDFNKDPRSLDMRPQFVRADPRNHYHRAYLYGSLESLNYDIANGTIGQQALTFECSNESAADAVSKLTTKYGSAPSDVIYCTLERGTWICDYSPAIRRERL